MSWSGEKSRLAAVALRDWLPSVINELEPFVSAKDIDAGARWQAEIAGQLDTTGFGIVCVTRENQKAPWINFEAGALAKTVGHSWVVPLAIDLKVADITYPLAQYQAQPLSEDGLQEVPRSLNKRCENLPSIQTDSPKHGRSGGRSFRVTCRSSTKRQLLVPRHLVALIVNFSKNSSRPSGPPAMSTARASRYCKCG